MQEANKRDPYQHTNQDRFLRQFKKSLDVKHQIIPKKELEGESPCLTDLQIQSITRKLLLNVEVIKGFSFPVWKLQRKFQKLLSIVENERCGLHKIEPKHKHTHIKAVGTSATDDLESDPSYIDSVLKKIDPTAVLPESDVSVKTFLDLDYKIRATTTNNETNIVLKDLLNTWLVVKILKKQPKRRLDDVKAEVTQQLNRKYYNPEEEGPLGNRFMLISLGEHQLSVDITTYQNLRRQYLHTPDRIQIAYNIIPITNADGSKTIVLTDQAFQRNRKDYILPEKINIRPDLSLLDLAQTLLDIKAKLVHFTSLETMDISGWFKLMQYYVHGYRSADEESRLLAIAAVPGSEELFWRTIERFCRNHFQEDQTGIYFYLLNGLLCMHRYGFNHHADMIRAYRPDWFGKDLSELQSFTRLLSCAGLLMLATENLQGDVLNVEFTFNSSKPTLRWTYKLDKKSYSFLIPFNPKQGISDFLGLFKDSPEFFLTMLRGRKAKQDLSLIVSILKYLKVQESDIAKIIQELGEESRPDVAKVTQFWLPIARQLKEVPAFKSADEILHFIREFLPTVTRTDFQNTYRPFVLDLLTKCLNTRDVIELSRVITAVDHWKALYPWIVEGSNCLDIQMKCFAKIVFLLSGSDQKLATATTLLDEFKTEVIRTAATPYIHQIAEHHLRSSYCSLTTLKALHVIRQWNLNHPWIFPSNYFVSIKTETLSRIGSLLMNPSSKIRDVQIVLAHMESTILQKEFAPHFLHIGNHLFQSPNNREALMACFVSFPWLYEENLEDSTTFIELLLKTCPASPERTALAQTYLSLYLKKGTDHDKIRSLLTLVKFSELPVETKKAVQAIYKPLINELNEKNDYAEIIRLYRWLGISGAATVAQVRGVLPSPLSPEFQQAFRHFICEMFETHVNSVREHGALYKTLVTICEWQQEYPWIFESKQNEIDFQKKVLKKLEELIGADNDNALVNLKEVLGVIRPEHQALFAPHVRSVLSNSLKAKDQQLIWNLVSLNLCLGSYPWVCAGEDAAKREMICAGITAIGHALDDTKHDHRWYNLADVYLRSFLTLPVAGIEAVNLLLKPCMRTHTLSKELVEAIEGRVDTMVRELAQDKRYREITEFQILLNLLGTQHTFNEESHAIILNAFQLLNALEFNTDRFAAFRKYIKEITLIETNVANESIVKIVVTLLAQSRESEALTVVTLMIKNLPATYAACAQLYFKQVAAKKVTKGDLNHCQTLLLGPEWTVARVCDPVLTERFRETVFDVCSENCFSEIHPYEAFKIVREATTTTNYKRWYTLFQQFDAVKQRDQVREMWESFLMLPIPAEKSVYIKTWMLGLRRAVTLGEVAVSAIYPLYERIKPLVETLPQSDISLEVYLGLFMLFARSPAEVTCWPLIHQITARFKQNPKEMELDAIRLYMYSPRIEDFFVSCKGVIYQFIVAVTHALPKSETIQAAVMLLKQARRFKATPENRRSIVYENAMTLILEIYRKLEKLKPSPIDSWDSVYNSFVETEYQPLVHEVLFYLHEKLKPVDAKDHMVYFPLFKCQIEPANLMYLFNYIMNTTDLPKLYGILPRRILGHPSTAPLLKNHAKVAHWVLEIIYRTSNSNVPLNNLDNYQNEVKDILLYANAPEGVASNPAVKAQFVQLIGSLAQSKSPYTASQVQALFLHCGLGRTPYEKKYQMISLRLNTSNRIFKDHHYLVINSKSPYRELESWRVEFLEFQATLIEYLINILQTHGSLKDDLEMGEYLGILIDTQINAALEVSKTTLIPSELAEKLVERIRMFMISMIMLPKTKEKEIKILNDIPLLVNLDNPLMKKYADRFFLVRTLHTHLAGRYSRVEVPYRFMTELSCAEKWINITQLVMSYTSPKFPQRDLAYLCQLLNSLLEKETEVQLDLLESCIESIFAFLIDKGEKGLVGSPVQTLEYFMVFVEKMMRLCLKDFARPNLTDQEVHHISAFILSHTLSRLAELSQVYIGIDRSRFKVALGCVKILLDLNPIMITKKQRRTRIHLDYLQIFVKFVLREMALCYKFDGIQAAEETALALAKLLMMKGWDCSDNETMEKINLQFHFLFAIASASGEKHAEELRKLTRKIYLFMNDNHLFDNLDPYSLKTLKAIL